MTLPLLTNSRGKSRRRCSRLHYYRYDLGIRPIEDIESLRFGTLVHLGLERWWQCLLPDQARQAIAIAHRGAAALTGRRLSDVVERSLDAMLLGDQLDAAIAAVGDAEDPYERVRAEEMLRGYHYRWQGEDLDPLAVEIEFRAPLVNPATGAASRSFDVGGKLDAIALRRSTGRVAIVEHKTSSEDVSPGSDYWKRLRIDSQVSTYFAGARVLGYQPALCLYDVLGKPGLRPSAVPLLDDDGVKIVHDATGQRVRTKDGKKWRETGDTAQGYVLQTRPETAEEFRGRLRDAIASDPDRYLARGEVVRLETEEAEHGYDTWQLARSMREETLAGEQLRARGLDPSLAHPRNPDACVMFGRACAFFDVCTGAASLDDTTRFERVENPHTELALAAG